MKSSIHAFFLVLIPAVITISVAIFFQNKILAIILLVIIFAVIGLGVAIPQMRLFGNFICSGDKSKKQIALTFDDGPDANSTPQLLDLLKEAKVEAAFFCVGKNVAANSELSARIVREGHLLENHSYEHSNATNFFTTARLKKALAQTQTAIQEATGIVPRFFRPPMGLSNPRIFRATRELDLKVIGWTIRSLDTRATDPEKIAARIARRLKPGAIILLHDGNIPAARLVLTVKLLLANLRERGYEVARLDKMLE